jgi:hypothetical protein
VPLYSRPKVEISLSNIHPVFPKWYMRYDLKLTVNPSPRFGLRFGFGELDLNFKDLAINGSRYGGVEGLLYFPNDHVSLYVLLYLGTSYDGVSGYYEEYSSFYFYSNFGFGLDFYFFDRAACFVEIQDFLFFHYSRYDGNNDVDVGARPGIIFGLKFGIY